MDWIFFLLRLWKQCTVYHPECTRHSTAEKYLMEGGACGVHNPVMNDYLLSDRNGLSCQFHPLSETTGKFIIKSWGLGTSNTGSKHRLIPWSQNTWLITPLPMKSSLIPNSGSLKSLDSMGRSLLQVQTPCWKAKNYLDHLPPDSLAV